MERIFCHDFKNISGARAMPRSLLFLIEGRSRVEALDRRKLSWTSALSAFRGSMERFLLLLLLFLLLLLSLALSLPLDESKIDVQPCHRRSMNPRHRQTKTEHLNRSGYGTFVRLINPIPNATQNSFTLRVLSSIIHYVLIYRICVRFFYPRIKMKTNEKNLIRSNQESNRYTCTLSYCIPCYTLSF